MADSALALDIYSLRAEVAYFLGKGRTETQAEWLSLSDSDRRMIDAHIASGLRMFYTARPWSFLRPWTTISLESGKWRYDLPDDFGYCNGDVCVQKDGGPRLPLRLIGQTQAMALDHDKAKGAPRFYAVSPKEMPANTGQRFELMVWPTPQADCTVVLRYSVTPRTITESRPYPYGGMLHSETIREACLAAAEADTDDTLSVHRQNYAQRLAESARIDVEQSTADNLGYNGDGPQVGRGRRDFSMYLNETEINPRPAAEVDDTIHWRP